MIVVMPLCRAQPNDQAEGDPFANLPAYEAFTDDLLKDIMPFMAAKYPLIGGREHQALAGLSMGGGQTLNIGLTHPETFAYLGAFSSAPNTKKNEELFPDPKALKQFKVIWLSCGDKDNLIFSSQRVHAYLKQQNVPHIYHVGSGGHDAELWKADLYHFSQLLFR